MIYPKHMFIGGQRVDVEILDAPLYTFFTCPKCNENYPTNPYSFPVLTGEHKDCPACGCKETRPVNNSYILGQYVVEENTIKNWHSDNDKVKGMCQKSFVHETIEAIDSIKDLKLDHTQITTIASALYEAFSSGNVAFSDEDYRYAYAA